nr:protein BASIC PENTACYSTEINE2-like [Ipomoea trifida]
MDDDGLNMRNWGYYEPTHKGHLGLQLMSSVVDRDTKPFLSGRDNPSMIVGNGIFHARDSIVSQVPITHIDYIRDGWINHRDKFLHMLPGNPYGGGVMAEPSGTHSSMQMLQQQQQQQPDSTKDASVSAEDPSLGKDSGPSKKRAAAAPEKGKKSKKGPGASKKNENSPAQRAKPAKKSIEVVISGVDMDISSIPTPVCTCTGTPQQCYRWGCGGWQSACCTTTISMYPLPMNNKRRGARIAGRKMSQGAFKKVLEKLAAEGYNFANPIDLRTHWAKHGTNKFVTIR